MDSVIPIKPATVDQADILADIIQQSYNTVADEFHLTPQNCPKHPSNCTADWVTHDFERGVTYYLYMSQGTPVGCAALEKADESKVYLERLAVLPDFRHQGIGKKLVDFIIDKAKIYQAATIGIGIIDEQETLKLWYKGLGFKMTGVKKFDHLPFTVGFMEKGL